MWRGSDRRVIFKLSSKVSSSASTDKDDYRDLEHYSEL